MITHLTLCCCLPKAETNRRNKEISLHIILHPISSGAKLLTAVLLETSHQDELKCAHFSGVTAYLEIGAKYRHGAF